MYSDQYIHAYIHTHIHRYNSYKDTPIHTYNTNTSSQTIYYNHLELDRRKPTTTYSKSTPKQWHRLDIWIQKKLEYVRSR